jgi:uncharacterized repeat protein (TIGR03803 family)
LHNFVPGDAAAVPLAGLTSDAAGNLFGTAGIATDGYGAVFELSPVARCGWNYSVIHTFGGHTWDGANPYSTVVLDSLGHLYGMTAAGGASGAGVVFGMTPTASGWKESVIYNFKGGTDGQAPFGNLTLGAPGHLYGTTLLGGTAAQGTAFEVGLFSGGQWREHVIHSFGSYSGDSLNPTGSLVIDGSGNLFGASIGGAYGNGAVFELTPSDAGWNEKLVYSFLPPHNSSLAPLNNVILDSAGNLYGVAPGGAKNEGVVFEVMP